MVAIEKIFMAKNASSALKLGQARGVILLSAAQQTLPVFEYNPTEVKRAVTGHGQAAKDQVAKVLHIIFGSQNFRTPDASDGVALALCHALQGSSRDSKDLPKRYSIQRGSRKTQSLAKALGLKR